MSSGRNIKTGGLGIRISRGTKSVPDVVFVRFETESGAGLHPRDRTLPFTPALSGAALAESGFGSVLLELGGGGKAQRYAAQALDGYPGTVFFEIGAGQKEYVGRLLSGMRRRPAHTAAYGVYVNPCAETILSEGQVDWCVTGEGEAVIPAFVRWLAGGCAGAAPAGLKWFRDGALRDSAPAQPVSTDDMPFVPASLLKSNQYHKDSFPISTGRPLKWGFILANRGCRFSCDFCTGMTRQSIDKRFRLCSPRRLLDEMNYQSRDCGRTIISVEDDLFTGDRGWTLEFCSLLESSGGRGPWIAQTRFDCLDEEVAAALRRAGCVGLTCGLESGSDSVLERLNKRETVAVIRETALMLRRHGFALRFTAMIGSPGETREDFEKTAALLRELNPLTAQVAFCTPYPDTALAGSRDAEGRQMRFESPARNLSGIEATELHALRLAFYKDFYLSASYLAAHARNRLGYALFNPRRAFRQAALFALFMARQFRRSLRGRITPVEKAAEKPGRVEPREIKCEPPQAAQPASRAAR